MANLENIEITGDIQRVIEQIANNYKNAIKNANAVATSNMLNFTYYPEINGKWFEVVFEMPKSKNGFPYWRVVENGRKGGKMPPLSAIEEWIKIKPVVPRTSGKKVPSTKQLAFLIARSIGEKGIKPKNLLSNALNESDGLINQLAYLIASEIEKSITEDIEQL